MGRPHCCYCFVDFCYVPFLFSRFVVFRYRWCVSDRSVNTSDISSHWGFSFVALNQRYAHVPTQVHYVSLPISRLLMEQE